MKKQLIAKLLVLAMAVAMVPVTILAASADNNKGYSTDYGYYSVGVDTAVVSQPIPDGATTAAFKAKAVDGVATYVINDSVIESLAKLVNKDGVIEVELECEGDGTTFVFTCSAKALAKLAGDTKADLAFKTAIGTVTIPNSVLAESIGTAGTVRIVITKTDSGIGVQISVAGNTMSSIPGLKTEAK